MLAEMRYVPHDKLPYKVFIKYKTVWSKYNEYADEQAAVSAAMQLSMRSDLPYIKRFEHGGLVNQN